MHSSPNVGSKRRCRRAMYPSGSHRRRTARLIWRRPRSPRSSGASVMNLILTGCMCRFSRAGAPPATGAASQRCRGCIFLGYLGSTPGVQDVLPPSRAMPDIWHSTLQVRPCARAATPERNQQRLQPVAGAKICNGSSMHHKNR